MWHFNDPKYEKIPNMQYRATAMGLYIYNRQSERLGPASDIDMCYVNWLKEYGIWNIESLLDLNMSPGCIDTIHMEEGCLMLSIMKWEKCAVTVQMNSLLWQIKIKIYQYHRSWG